VVFGLVPKLLPNPFTLRMGSDLGRFVHDHGPCFMYCILKNLGMNPGSVFTISAQLLFLPPLLHAAQLIPKELQEKWQKDVDVLHAKLGGTPERPIEIVIISLDTPDYLTVICAAGVRQLMLGSVGDVGMAQAMFSCHCWPPRCQQMLPTFVDQFQQFFIDKLCQLCQLLPDVEIPWKGKIPISGKA